MDEIERQREADDAKEVRPNVIDSLLYGTENLKTVLIDNFANRDECRPLKEFKELVKENARGFLKSWIDKKIVYPITEEEIKEFEKQYYGD